MAFLSIFGVLRGFSAPWGLRETGPGRGFYINPSRRGPVPGPGGSPGATLRRRGGSPKGVWGPPQGTA